MFYNSIRLLVFIFLVCTQSSSAQTDNKTLFPWEKDGQLGYIDSEGRFSPTEAATLEYPARRFTSSLQSYQNDRGAFGFKNTAGEIIIEAGFEQVGDFVDGLTWVKIDYKRYYYIDTNGNELINYTFDRAYNFSNGLARVKDFYAPKGYNGYGYLNTKGEVVIPLIYEKAMDFMNGFALVKDAKGWWLMDKSGTRQFGPCLNLKSKKVKFWVE